MIKTMMEKVFKKIDFINIFILIIFLSLFESIIYTFFINDSRYFFIGQVNSDPGGDFYLSLLFSSKLTPYKYDIFPYPPFSVIICYLLNFICHDNLSQMIEGMSWNDALVKVYSNVFAFKNTNFILSILTLISLSFILSNYIIKNKKVSYSLSNILSFSLIANAGLLQSLVRGNLLTMALLFTTIYILYNKSENKIIKEFSFISLAIAFNIKPYVAVFGFVFLAEKRYKDAIKTALYALFLFFVPFIFLQGNYIENIKSFFNTLLNFGGRNFSMIGLKSFINFLLYFFGKIMNIEISTNKVGSIISILFSLFLLIFTFNNIKKWQRVMLFTLIMIMASTNHAYILAFMFIPAMMFLCEENEVNFYNVFYLFSFIFLLAPIRYGTTKIIYFENFLLVCLCFVLVFQIYFKEKIFGKWSKK